MISTTLCNDLCYMEKIKNDPCTRQLRQSWLTQKFWIIAFECSRHPQMFTERWQVSTIVVLTEHSSRTRPKTQMSTKYWYFLRGFSDIVFWKKFKYFSHIFVKLVVKTNALKICWHEKLHILVSSYRYLGKPTLPKFNVHHKIVFPQTKVCTACTMFWQTPNCVAEIRGTQI